MHYHFGKDLTDAQKTETEIIRAIEKRYGSKQVGEKGKTNAWDFEMFFPFKGTFSFEIKEDIRAKETGNIAVEYHCREKLSGISVSKADYYIYRIHQEAGIQHYIIETPELKRLIKSQFYWKKVVGGDPDSQTKMYLFKVDVFIKYAKLLDI